MRNNKFIFTVGSIIWMIVMFLCFFLNFGARPPYPGLLDIILYKISDFLYSINAPILIFEDLMPSIIILPLLFIYWILSGGFMAVFFKYVLFAVKRKCKCKKSNKLPVS